MMRIRSLALAAALGATLAACSNDSAKDSLGGTSSSGTGGTMSIVACSLGCNTFQTTTVNCTVNEVFVNEEIRLTFSRPIDLSTFDSSTFRVVDKGNGLVPPGTFSADPSNPSGIIYRPLLTFNSSGSPVFGLVEDRQYEIFLPGANLDPPPYIRSLTGRPLGTRMRCLVTAGGGINDPVAGAPTVQIRVNTVLKDGMGNPVIDPATNEPFLGPLVLADNTNDVHRRSNITFTFNDVMNPATLVNPVSKLSPSIRVFIDPDGNLADPSDQVELFGQYQIVIDQDELKTTVIFNPDTEFPSAGPLSQPLPRRILVSLPPTIVDLGGNSVANASSVSFVPERLLFSQVELPKAGGEDFETTSAQTAHQEDTQRSGAFWGPAITTNNELEPGIGGGSGRLGDLNLLPGELLTLYTDGMRPMVALGTDGGCIGQAVDMMGTPLFEPQLFGPDALVHDQDGSFTVVGPETNLPCDGDPSAMPAPIPALENDSRNITSVLIDNYDPMTTTPGTSTFQVTDGIYEFASLNVAAGAVLRFVGPRPPRIFVRGEAFIRGRIEINGKDASQSHSSQSNLGGVGAVAGPGGGRGGEGGMRPGAGGSLAGIVLGTPNPLITMLSEIDGDDGQGFEFPSGTPGSPLRLGGGTGGSRWPNATQCDPAIPANCDLPDGTRGLDDSGGLTFNPLTSCGSNSIGGPGGGGGRAQTGGTGVAMLLIPTDPPGTIPPPTTGGSQVTDSAARTLAPEQGFLVGGSGGGGSGGHANGTTRGSFPSAMPCRGTMNTFIANSGAGGGGGGGAIQVQAGARVVLDGVIDASGGIGGRGLDPAPSIPGENVLVSPGGAGSGGSVLIQTLNFQLPAIGNRINVQGGASTMGLNDAASGPGSMGLVHVQAGISGISVPSLNSVSAIVAPYDPAVPAASADWVSVDSSGWTRLQFSSVPATHPLTGDTQNYVPDSFSGAQSCWMRPEGNFFRLNFLADTATEAGWTMDVRISPNEAVPPLTYRISSLDPLYDSTTIEGVFAADVSSGGLTSKIQDPESVMGGTVGSPFIVRFQGARAVKEIPDLCDVDLSGEFSPIQPDSLTPWVLHPAELNTYWDQVFPTAPGEVSKRRSTMIRYQIIFNRRALNGFAFSGVDNVTIKAQPD